MHTDSTPPIPLDSLREMAERGKTRRPELASRIERAVFIVVMRRIEQRGENDWLIESDTEVGKSYGVTLTSCSCPDFARAPLGLCKHRLALGLARMAEYQQGQQQATRERERLSDERVAVSYGLAFAGGAV